MVQSSNSRIRVAMVMYRDNLHVGGALRVAEILAESLDPARVEVHLVFMYGGPGPLGDKGKIRCHYIGARGPAEWGGWRRARSLFRELNPHIVHFHEPVYWLHGALLGRGYRKVMHLHGPYFPSQMRMVEKVLARAVARITDWQICITEQLRSFVLDRNWAVAARSSSVYNAVDCRHFGDLPARDEVRRRLGLPADARVVGMVCRLAWYKGCDDGVRILSRLDDNWYLLFAGDGPITLDLIKLAAELGVADRIRFAGMLPDVRIAYAAMDAFLFLSRCEPFGLVLAEAMASGVPVFGLAGDGGFSDPEFPLVTSDNSVVLPRRNPSRYDEPEADEILDELAARIHDLDERPWRYQSMVQNARNWVRQRFDASRQAEEVSDIYARVVGRTRAEGPRGRNRVRSGEPVCRP